MFNRSSLLLLLLALAATASAETPKHRYDNYSVFNVQVDTVAQLEAVQRLTDGSVAGITLWNRVQLGRASDVMVAPHAVQRFVEFVETEGLSGELKVANVQSLIDNEQPEQLERQSPRPFNWTTYHTYDEIYAWLDTQLVQHPAILTDYTIGLSYENRTIRAVRLSHKAGNPAVFIDANIHAREWVTSATATWLLNELLTSTDPAIVELAENIDWFVVPVLNVDGYAYSHEVNRFWRKTRQPHSLFCTGADPNRNFDKFWRQYDGASGNPCSDIFAGPSAESEPEIRAFAAFYKTIAKSVKLYLTFHSYGQMLLTPFGHSTELPANNADIQRIGQRAKEAIAVREGRVYTVGPIATVIYPTAGGSVDWAMGIEGLQLAYAFEFRDRPNGGYGFMLPGDQIVPNALEAFDGIRAMIAEARVLKYL